MTSIAFISDIHFGRFSRTAEFTVPGEPIKDETKGAVPLRKSLVETLIKNKAEYLFIAGDLTSTGSPQEFELCYKEIASIAKDSGISINNVVIGLGNHDIDWKISKLCEEYLIDGKAEDENTFELVKEKYQRIAAEASMINMAYSPNFKHIGPVPCTGVIEYEEMIVFILNSGWQCSYNQILKHGKLSKQQLEWFTEYSSLYRADKRWKIVLLHHHPFNYPYPTIFSDVSLLEEGSELLESMGNSSIDLVLHGHRHHPKAKTSFETGWRKPITFICAGSVSVNAEHRQKGQVPNTLHIIHLDSDPGTLGLHNYQYSASKGWDPVAKRIDEIPIDSFMRLGRLFSDDDTDIESALSKLETNKSLKWDRLEESLQYLGYDKLNERVREQFMEGFVICGEFPKDVIIVREEDS